MRVEALHIIGDGVGVHIGQWNLGHDFMEQSLEVLAGYGFLLAVRAMSGKTTGGNARDAWMLPNCGASLAFYDRRRAQRSSILARSSGENTMQSS